MIPDMPDTDYFDGSHFGIHAIQDFDKYGPRGFWDRHIDKNVVNYSSTAFSLGTAAHEYILRGRAAYEKRCVQKPKTYENNKGEIKKWSGNATVCKEWIADNTDKIVLSETEHYQVLKMYESVHQHPLAQEYFSEGDPEVGFRTVINGLPVQCKADWFNDRYIIDLKTCQSLNDFHKHFHKYGYWRQAAHYINVIFMVTGERLPFIFIAVEKESPYRTECFEISEDYYAEADCQNSDSISALATVYLKGTSTRNPWPQGSNSALQTIDLPGYIL